MKLIKELDRREVGKSGNKVRFALFECDFCKTQIEKQKQNGLRDLSCGCTRYELVSESNSKHGDSVKHPFIIIYLEFGQVCVIDAIEKLTKTTSIMVEKG